MAKNGQNVSILLKEDTYNNSENRAKLCLPIVSRQPKQPKQPNVVSSHQLDMFESRKAVFLRYITMNRSAGLEEVNLQKEQSQREFQAVKQIVQLERANRTSTNTEPYLTNTIEYSHNYMLDSPNGTLTNETEFERNSSDALSVASQKSVDRYEIFDPSLIFVSIHRCYYWDSKDRIRKGKIFLTRSELIFKCSRMPFVKVRFFLKEVKEVAKIKNYKHKLETVISVETTSGKTYAFYKFRLPRNVIKNVLVQLVEDCKREYDNTQDNESINTNLLRLRRLSQPITSITSLFRSSSGKDKSEANTPVETEQPAPIASDNSKHEFASSKMSLKQLKKSLSAVNTSDDNNKAENRFGKYQKNFRKTFKRTFQNRKSNDTNSEDVDGQVNFFDKTHARSKSLGMMDQTFMTKDFSAGTSNYNSDGFKSLEDNSDIQESDAEIYVVEHSNIPIEDIDPSFIQDEKIENTNNSQITKYFPLLLSFLSLIVFSLLTLNNFLKLYIIERQMSDLV